MAKKEYVRLKIANIEYHIVVLLAGGCYSHAEALYEFFHNNLTKSFSELVEEGKVMEDKYSYSN